MKRSAIRQFLSRIYRLVIALATLFTYLFDSVCLLFLPVRSPRAKFVLVVRLDNIGDFILWIPAAKELRRLYPAGEWRLVLAANLAWSSLAEELRIFDEVLPVETSRFFTNLIYRFRVLCLVRRVGSQIAIHPTYSREILRGDALIRASGAEQRIGSQGDFSRMEPWLKPLADMSYTRLVPATFKLIPELERNTEFVAGLGGSNILDFPSLPVISSTLPLVLEGIPYFVLFPGASWTGRQWPVARFAELAFRITQQTGWFTVICGGVGDATIAKQVQILAGTPMIDLTGKTDLKQLQVVLASSRLVITNETSAAHMSPAVGTPTVCVLGGGHYGRFLPHSLTNALPNMAVVNEPMECYNCNWKCIYTFAKGDAVPCIAKISVEAVWRAVTQLLPADITNSSSAFDGSTVTGAVRT
jgi:ADP-heptose:LPS heptosyltransferase